MGFTWWDVAEVVVPVAAGIVGTPAAGIAVSAAMKAGKTYAEGGSTADILKSGALGAATGAGSALGAGALGKAVGKAGEGVATKAGEKAVEKLAGEAVSKGGLSFAGGMPQIAYGAAGQGGLDTASKTIAKGASKAAAASKFSDVLGKAQGDKKSKAALKTVAAGGKALDAADQAYQFMTEPSASFSQQHAAMVGQAQERRLPGMKPDYQFGHMYRAGGTPTVSFMMGRGY